MRIMAHVFIYYSAAIKITIENTVTVGEVFMLNEWKEEQ